MSAKPYKHILNLGLKLLNLRNLPFYKKLPCSVFRVISFQVVIDEHSKFFKLLELLGIYQEQGSVIVFVDKQENADELMKDLMKHSYPCMSLHGGIDQYDRDSTIMDFRAGNIKLLVHRIVIQCFV